MDSREVESIRSTVRDLLAPMPVELSTDEARLRRFDQLFRRLSPAERLVWQLVGEGEPSRFVDRILLVRLVPESLAKIIAHYRRDGTAMGVWPEIPPSLRSNEPTVGLDDIYQASYGQRADLFRLWARDDNQDSLVERVTHGLDNDLGEFLVPADVDVNALVLLLRPETWGAARRDAPSTEHMLQAMTSMVRVSGWVGKYLGAELKWGLFMDNDVVRLASMSHKLEGHQRVLLQRQQDEWQVLEGDPRFHL